MDVGDGSSRRIPWEPGRAPGAAGDQRPIGEIFVELGFVSRAELDSALEVQRATGGRIGEILVEQGSLSRIELASALAEHWEPRAYPEDETLEGSLNGAARSVTREAEREPSPDGRRKPRRGLLRRSTAHEDALEEQLAQLEARVRADHAWVLDERFQGLSRRLGGVESRVDEIGRLDARLDTVSVLAADLRNELTTLGEREPASAADPTDRLRELSLRIDRAARDAHDRAVALAEELRVELAANAARLDARIQEQLEATAALERRLAEIREAAPAEAPELRGELGSLAGRLDELLGLRHADAQVARVANERLAARLEGLIAGQADEAAAALAVAMDSRDDPGLEARFGQGLDRLAADSAELTRRLELHDAAVAASVEAVERAVLEGLADLGRQLSRKATKHGKPKKRLRRSIESLAIAIEAAEARLARPEPTQELES